MALFLLCKRSACRLFGRLFRRGYSSAHYPALRRSYLYGMCSSGQQDYINLLHIVGSVPSSSERMLQKSLQTRSDTIIYDLEDSVAPSQKETARKNLLNFLKVSNNLNQLLRRSIQSRLNPAVTEQVKFSTISRVCAHRS